MYRIGVVASFIILVCSGCTWFEATHTLEKEVSVHLPDSIAKQSCGAYLWQIHTVVIDHTCTQERLGDDAFWTAHEEAHPVAIYIGLAFGPGIAGQERAANCLATVVTHHVPLVVDNAKGYWVCPPWAIQRTLAALHKANIDA